MLALAGLVLATTAGTAQVISVGASAAPVFPVGTFSEGRSLDDGWHVGVNARFDFRTHRYGVQADLGVASSKLDEESGSGDVQSWNGGVAAFYRFRPIESSWRPYAIGGVGVYYVEQPASYHITPALNAGVGLEVGTRSIRAFVEARYHIVFLVQDDLEYIPLSVGVRYALNP